MNGQPIPAVVITGASSGIGAEFARYYGRLNASLFLIARREEKLKGLVEELRAGNAAGSIEYFKADLSEPGCAERIVTALHNKGMTASLLINNAGMAVQTTFIDRESAVWLQHLQLNIMTFVDLTRRLLPDLISTKGKVMNIASGSAFQALPNYAIYAASKSFMLSLSEALAVELEESGVTVTCICPGAVRTDFNANAGVNEDIGPAFIWMDARQVVEQSARALDKGKTVFIPGWINKLNAWGQRFVPRSLVVRMAGRIYSR